jgi:hypothetical protein
MRASDEDRDEAVRALGEHHAAGRITLPEFTTRMEQALGCTFIDELDPLFADLPAAPSTTTVTVAAQRAPLPARPPGPRPVVLMALPLLVVLAVVAVSVGPFFPFWLPIAMFWLMGGPRRHRGFPSQARPGASRHWATGRGC